MKIMKAKNSELIGKYLNRYGYSDINPIGKIIGTRGKTIAIIQRVEAEKQLTKLQWEVGGFSGYCLNQYNQEWLFEEKDEIFEVKLTKTYLKRVQIDDKPVKYYDFNF